MIMHPSAFLTRVDNSSDVFVTNTSFFTSEKFFKCMTELFSFDRPAVFNSQREYKLFSNVHETFIGVNFSPRTQNLYILTI